MNRIIEKIDGNGKSYYYPQWRFLKIFWIYYQGLYESIAAFDDIEKCKSWLRKNTVKKIIKHYI